ncbi:MAG: thioredoxin family protein [Xanthomonadales bacterium]|nr:thioredoxin family protein [Xanthomonadales bacterium]
MKSTLFAIVFFVMMALSGCDQPAGSEQEASAAAEAVPVQAAPVQEVKKEEIEWFEGSVEEAFELARAENKPVFLYWGAVWCPPCVEIRQTVFKSQQFIAQSKLFIPVYLDGDTERAQLYGEKFGTKVYPTMIVFSPETEEVTRLHAGIDISAYNTVLELSLDSMRPTSQLVATALEAPELLADTDLRRLAYYSWYDNEKALPEGTPPEFFNALSEVTTERHPEISARFYLQYLVSLSGKDSAMADPEKLRAIINTPELMFACWDYLTSNPSQISAVFGEHDAEIESLQKEWATVVKDHRHDDRLSTARQLSGWSPYLEFHFQGDEEKTRPLPDDVVAAIRADGQAADEKTSGKYSRQSVISTLTGIYLDAGLVEDARQLLLAEIEKSNTPYYFMSYLAYLEEQQGNIPLALDWRKKAFEDSSGDATRIRWWAHYVQSVVRMAPENDELVLQSTRGLFDGAQSLDELFVGANFRNLQKTSAALEKWDREQHPEQSALSGFQLQLEDLCSVQPADSVELGNCRSLVAAEQ